MALYAHKINICPDPGGEITDWTAYFDCFYDDGDVSVGEPPGWCCEFNSAYLGGYRVGRNRLVEILSISQVLDIEDAIAERMMLSGEDA